MKPPKCPACGASKGAPHGHNRFKCRRCATLFDSDPEEGGDYDSRDPSKRLQREEKERARELRLAQKRRR